MGKGKKERRGIHWWTWRISISFLVAIHESGDKLGQLLMVLEFGDDTVLGATHTLVAT